MTERLLQYIWQFQYLNTVNLQTTNGQSLQILFPGNDNTNQGPDFLDARIKIADTVWAGSIELHIHSGDWTLHNHSNDKNYDNVILHVVWKDEGQLQVPFPTLELQHRVSKLLLKKYEELMYNQCFIPCERHIHGMDTLIHTKWKERLLVERLQQKALYIGSLLEKNRQHWEETFWWMLSRNFGIKINADAFEKIAQSVPLTIISKHRNQLIQLEALLIGQAGLLNRKLKDDYPLMLRREYRHLQKKYKLPAVQHPLYFLRMRPANFPTIRLAQLAMIVHTRDRLFDSIKHTALIKDAESMFDISLNGYWHDHYLFDEPGKFRKKSIGREMISNIFINTIIPVLYAYGYLNNKESFKNKALSWMEQLPAETNRICHGFELLGLENKSAFDSQAFIQLKNNYCNEKKCLQCAIGNSILRETKK